MISFKEFLAETHDYPLNAPHTHIGKRYKDMLKFKKEQEPIKELVQAIKDLSWQDIKFIQSDSGDTYYVLLPENVRDLISTQYQTVAAYKRQDWGTWSGTSGVDEVGPTGGTIGKYGPSFSVDKNALNRVTMLPNAISVKMRGLKLGGKMLRALLAELQYVTADIYAAEETKRLWINLAQNKLDDSGNPTDQHVNSVAIGDNLLAIDPSSDVEDKLSYARHFMDQMANTVTLKGKDFDVDPILRKELEAKEPHMFEAPDTTQKAGYAPSAPAKPDKIKSAAAAPDTKSAVGNKVHPADMTPISVQNQTKINSTINGQDTMLFVSPDMFTTMNDGYALYYVRAMGSQFRVESTRDSDWYDMDDMDFDAWKTGMEQVRLKEVTSKTQLKKGDRVFVKAHKTYYGMACRVDRVKLGANDREQVYVNVKAGSLAIEMRPKSVSKLVKYYSNESVGVMTFKEFVNEDVDFDRLDNTHFSGTNMDMKKFHDFGAARSEVVKAFTELKWRDIKFFHQGDLYFPLVPEGVKHAIEKFETAWAGKAKPDEAKVKLDSFFGRWRGVNGLSDDKCLHFRLDDNRRTHFEVELSINLRNLGVGVKLYRALLHEVKYMTSFSNATTQAQRAWASMVAPKLDGTGQPTDEHVYAMSLGDTVLAIDHDVSNDQVLEILRWFTTKRVKNFEVTAQNVGIDKHLKHAADLLDPTVLAPFDTEHIKQAALDKADKEAKDKLAKEKAAQAAKEKADAKALETLKDRIESFCYTDQNDSSWEVGDFIVVRDYLMMEHKNLPIRKVVKKEGDVYYAVKATNAKAFDTDGTLVDARQTSYKPDWVKAKSPKPGSNLPPTVKHNTKPDDSPVPAVAVTPEPAKSADAIKAENDFFNDMFADPVSAAPLADDMDGFVSCHGVSPGDLEGVNAHEMKKRQRIADDATHLIVQAAALTDNYSSYAVFAAEFKGTVWVTNLRTGEKKSFPTTGKYGEWFYKYKMEGIKTEQIQKKTEVGKNTKVFVYNHRTYFGILASVDRIKLGKDDRQQIYVRCKKTGLAIEMRPNNLHKIK